MFLSEHLAKEQTNEQVQNKDKQSKRVTKHSAISHWSLIMSMADKKKKSVVCSTHFPT